MSKDKDDSVCPYCGRCKYCGRGCGLGYYPAYPYYPQPYYPQPYQPWISWTGSTTSMPVEITYTS
jgi:hypothetical protein